MSTYLVSLVYARGRKLNENTQYSTINVCKTNDELSMYLIYRLPLAFAFVPRFRDALLWFTLRPRTT